MSLKGKTARMVVTDDLVPNREVAGARDTLERAGQRVFDVVLQAVDTHLGNVPADRRIAIATDVALKLTTNQERAPG